MNAETKFVFEIRGIVLQTTSIIATPARCEDAYRRTLANTSNVNRYKVKDRGTGIGHFSTLPKISI